MISQKISSINRIAVLITCHNRREKTLSCLHALYAQNIREDVGFVVYLVDDGCTDGTGDAVRKQFPAVHILQGDGSLYWCGGMRLAWAEAMKEDYDAYLWLNDDTVLLPGALDTMLATAREVHAKEGHDGIIIGACRDPRSGRHSYGGRIRCSPRTHLPDKTIPPGKEKIQCDTMEGNVVLVTQHIFRVLGNLSSEYTHAFGDTDYGMRARQHGIPLYMAPGYVALCEYNNRVRPWTDPSVPIKKRWANMISPLGLPPKQWYVYVKRHTGVIWPVYFFKPIFRVILPHLWNQR
ncbi:glycosyltransferase family 2 protein [Desulforhabdus sp. TSK]|uniref:glycosyltransferase family 2 protein n=1 Tax=Desulforhabdus sp. TSK TaxID=2925014 RepID=UPI001FC8B575|nr:glycosyltransferase family 2 protein [Desulforhabdus sp. TSK]